MAKLADKTKAKLKESGVTDLLDQWGRWSRSGLGCKSLEAPTDDNSHWITDDIAMWIESAVGQLGMVDANKRMQGYKSLLPRYKAVIIYHKDSHNIPMLANALKCGEPKAALSLKAGESFIECFLGLHEEFAEKVA